MEMQRVARRSLPILVLSAIGRGKGASYVDEF